MEFRILGPLQVSAPAGRPCPLVPFQARVLAVLLLAANDAVPLPGLVDAVWDGDPPATAKRQIQNAVSALRRQLAAAGIPGQLITADRTGYRIGVDARRLDAHRFRDLVARAEAEAAAGQTRQAADRLAAAEALWRGPALAGVGGRGVEAGAARLDEQRLTATELRLGLELDLGRHRELAGELAELVAAHPLRESLVGLRMRALHAAGRRADALAAYHRIRVRLADELGIDPGTELRGLYARLLRDDDPPARAAPASAGRRRRVPRQLPTGTRAFVGRTAELAELTRLLDEVDGAATILAISGTAGVGKTALAVHWAHQVAGRFPDGQLYVNLRGYDPAAAPTDPAAAVRRFLDAFGVPAQRIPADAEAQVNLYRTELADRRVLVVLDNARDTGHVRPLLPATRGCLTVVTSRDTLTGLVAIEGAHPLTLRLLSPAEAGDLVTGRVGAARSAAEPAAVGQIVSRCARLPLALVIAAARAAQRPDLTLAGIAAELGERRDRLDAFDAGDATADLRAVFSWSYDRLSAGAARLFRFLGLHAGPHIGAPAAASLAGIPPAQVLPLLAELTRAHLIEAQGGHRYAFHDLLRAYAGERAHAVDREGERRAAIHRVLDHYLHTGYAAALALDPHRDPIPLAPAVPGVYPERPSGQSAALAWMTAEHAVLAAAVDHAAESGFDPHAWRLAWTMSTYLDGQGHWHDWIAVHSTGLAAADRLGDRPAAVRALRSRGAAHERLGRYDDAVADYRRALAVCADLGDRSAQAHLHLGLARVFARQGDYREALETCRRAVELHADTGDEAAETRALNNLGWYHAQLGEYEPALAYCSRALALHQDQGDLHGESQAWDSLGYAYQHLGDTDRAVECYGRARAILHDIGSWYLEAVTLIRLGDTHRAAGDTGAARTVWQAARTILADLDHPERDRVEARLAELAGRAAASLPVL